MRMPSLRQVLIWAVVLAVLVGLVLWGAPLLRLFGDRESMEGLVESWGAWGPLAIIVLQVLQTLVAPVPGQVVGFVSGYVFGIWWGTLHCMVGMLVGTYLGLLLARRYGHSLVARLSNPRTVARLEGWVGRHSVTPRRAELFLFLIFLFPFTPSDVASLVAGLTSIPIWRIMLLAAIGRLPGVLVPVLIGAGSVELTPAQWALLVLVAIAAAVLIMCYEERLEQGVLNLISWFRGGS